jgi:hypothetical protein
MKSTCHRKSWAGLLVARFLSICAVAEAHSQVRSSVSLSPAVATITCKLGQSTTQVVTLTNRTDQELVFQMIAEDVVVRDGKRIFVAAGETRDGIAASAVFSRTEVAIKPMESSSVGVTFTLPPQTPLRAALAVFSGLTKVSGGGPLKMTASLGTLFTFTASETFKIDVSPLTIKTQTNTANVGISQTLTNTGSEPVIAGGLAAVLNDAGAIVGKASFEQQRLLPGESLPFTTQYPAKLENGPYRIMASFQYAGKVTTTSGSFSVP